MFDDPRLPSLARAVFQQLPRIARRFLIEQQHDVILIGRALLQLVRQQKIEHRSRHRAVVTRAGDRAFDVLIDQLLLGREKTHLRPRASCQGSEAQPPVRQLTVAPAAKDLEALPPPRGFVVREATQPAVPPVDRRREIDGLPDPGLLGEHVQRFQRLHGPVFPQLDELERADPLGLLRRRERLVRAHGSPDERVHRIGHRHAARARSDEECRDAELAGVCCSRSARLLAPLERVLEERPREAARQLRCGQAPHRAEPDDERPLEAEEPCVRAPRVGEDRAGFNRPRVQAHLVTPRQRALERKIEVLLRADDGIPGVVADRDHVSRERQVSVHHADGNRPLRPYACTALARSGPDHRSGKVVLIGEAVVLGGRHGKQIGDRTGDGRALIEQLRRALREELLERPEGRWVVGEIAVLHVHVPRGDRRRNPAVPCHASVAAGRAEKLDPIAFPPGVVREPHPGNRDVGGPGHVDHVLRLDRASCPALDGFRRPLADRTAWGAASPRRRCGRDRPAR